jgi:hypothetical protein
MFHVKPNAIVTDAPNYFREPRIAHPTHPRKRYKAAGSEFLQYSTFRHGLGIRAMDGT